MITARLDTNVFISALLVAGHQSTNGEVIGRLAAGGFRKDDYLLAPAIRARVDYVVSGDKDLLVPGEVEGVNIVSPVDFLALLDKSTTEATNEST